MCVIEPPGHLRLRNAGVRWGFSKAHLATDEATERLTLAREEGLSDDGLRRNWATVLNALGPDLDPSKLALMSQVHGGRVLEVRESTGPLAVAGECDGLVTASTDVVLAVRVADCVPILFASEGVIGAAHAGWRGVAAGVARRTVEKMRGLGAGQIHAWIGPHIQRAAYQVGPEVVEGIEESGVPREIFALADVGDRWRVDLGAAVAHQLNGCGEVEVETLGACTSSPSFFSWRREGPASGRQAGLIVRCP